MCIEGVCRKTYTCVVQIFKKHYHHFANMSKMCGYLTWHFKCPQDMKKRFLIQQIPKYYR